METLPVNMKPVTRQQMIENQAQDDLQMREYYPAVYHLAQTILQDPEEADDAAQESFVAAALAMDHFQQRCSYRTWLFSITINICRGILRKKQARQRLTSTLKSMTALFTRQTPTEELVEENQQSSALWAAVNRLDEKHRLPILLRYLDDLTAPEIAQILGITEGTVYSRIHYARQYLYQQLGASMDLTPLEQEVER